MYHFFWSGPFSNWYKASFWDYGIEYNCVEQYMMANKAMLFNDESAYMVIMGAIDPRYIKSVGRSIKNYNQQQWDFFKQQIVFRGCLQKFTQNGELRQQLLETGDAILVEASPYDRIWGIGFDASSAPQNIDKWGENLLGKILTELKGLLQ